MQLPTLKYNSRIGKTIQEKFAGYNHTMDAGDGDIWDMQNLSSRYAPLLTTRLPRKQIASLSAPNGLYAMEELAYVDGTNFYYNGVQKGTVADGRKTFASLGNRIIIMPDKCYYDTEQDEFGTLEKSKTMRLRVMDGFYAGEFAEANTLWNATVNWNDSFNVGDAVTISGMSNDDNNKTPIIREISEDGHSLRFYENVFTIDWDGRVEETDPEPMKAQLTGTRYLASSVTKITPTDEATMPYTLDQTTAITASAEGAQEAVGKYFYQLVDSAVEGVQSSVYYKITEASFSGNYLELTLEATRSMSYHAESGMVTVKREMPDLDWVCANENRLWGCKGDTIYASKLGDPFNWNVFDGLSSDSYAVDAGSPGDFTACVAYAGYPVFFKQHHIYKMYGTTPSNFELVSSATMGVDNGSGQSLAIAGETLFYLGPQGVTAYAGAVPTLLHDAFGTDRYQNATGGTTGTKYYISAKKIGGGWQLFTYDTQAGMWHREDDIQAIGFARTEEGAYMLTSTGKLLQLDADDGTETVEWWAEFGDLTEGEPNRKAPNRIQIRMELEKGAKFRVEINYDSKKRWDTIMNIVGERDKQSFILPIIPRRADHWRLRLSGSGGCTVYSIAREFYKGSDWR